MEQSLKIKTYPTSRHPLLAIRLRCVLVSHPTNNIHHTHTASHTRGLSLLLLVPISLDSGLSRNEEEKWFSKRTTQFFNLSSPAIYLPTFFSILEHTQTHLRRQRHAVVAATKQMNTISIATVTCKCIEQQQHWKYKNVQVLYVDPSRQNVNILDNVTLRGQCAHLPLKRNEFYSR